jgi:hypothetical protein
MMSFSAQDLSVLAYANGFTHWHYRTRDSLHDLIAPRATAANDNSYFAGAGEMLRAGDQITVNLLGAMEIGLVQAVVAAISADGEIRLTVLAATPHPTPVARAAA